jgi:hypothetical protein
VSIPHGWPSMPRDPVDLPAPLYPNAVQSSRKVQVVFYDRPASAYEKTAVAEFTIPTRVGPALAWYAKAFATCGYHTVSHGKTNDNGVSARGLTVQSSTFPNLYLSVSLQRLSGSQSLLVYYGVVVSLPERPVNTYVPTNERRVRITYVFPDGRHKWRLSIDDPQLVGTLVEAVDAGATWGASKSPDYIGHTCWTLYNQGRALLDFIPPAGKHMVVYVDYSCRNFGIVGSHGRVQEDNKIEDYDRSVWYAVSYVAYRYCLEHRCRTSP